MFCCLFGVVGGMVGIVVGHAVVCVLCGVVGYVVYGVVRCVTRNLGYQVWYVATYHSRSHVLYLSYVVFLEMWYVAFFYVWYVMQWYV